MGIGLPGPDILPSAPDIDSCFAPYVASGDWEAAADAAERSTRAAFRHRMAFGWIRKLRRTQKAVAHNYDLQWAGTPLTTQLRRDGPAVACEWRDRKLLARAVGTKRVHLLHLVRALDALQPQSVLEVGAGNGLNLITLAACRPGMRLFGVELTPHGVEAARQVAALPALPKIVEEFAPESPRETSIDGAVDFRCGDARALPFADRSFDLVYTALALEQMEEIRPLALREIARVARRWVIMIEPFRDFNAAGLRRTYIRAHDYFSARVADLPDYGLEPRVVSADMPHKVTLRPAFVLAGK